LPNATPRVLGQNVDVLQHPLYRPVAELTSCRPRNTGDPRSPPPPGGGKRDALNIISAVKDRSGSDIRNAPLSTRPWCGNKTWVVFVPFTFWGISNLTLAEDPSLGMGRECCVLHGGQNLKFRSTPSPVPKYNRHCAAMIVGRKVQGRQRL